MNVDADSVTAFVALASLPLSALAAFISIRADARSKVAARSQVYLALRARFFEVHAQLPPGYADPDWRPTLKGERAAATRYWHHAFDEWYATTRLDPGLLRSLWQQYFSGAVISGLRHNGLRAHLLESVALRGEHDELWMSFVSEMERLWRRSHPESAGACRGLACDHADRHLAPQKPETAGTTDQTGFRYAKTPDIGSKEVNETSAFEQEQRAEVAIYLRRFKSEGVMLTVGNVQAAPVLVAGGEDDTAGKAHLYFVRLPEGSKVLPVDWRRFSYDHAMVKELLTQCVQDNLQLFRFEPWSEDLRRSIERTMKVALGDLRTVFDVKYAECERTEADMLQVRLAGEHANGALMNYVWTFEFDF